MVGKLSQSKIFFLYYPSHNILYHPRKTKICRYVVVGLVYIHQIIVSWCACLFFPTLALHGCPYCNVITLESCGLVGGCLCLRFVWRSGFKILQGLSESNLYHPPWLRHKWGSIVAHVTLGFCFGPEICIVIVGLPFCPWIISFFWVAI